MIGKVIKRVFSEFVGVLVTASGVADFGFFLRGVFCLVIVAFRLVTVSFCFVIVVFRLVPVYFCFCFSFCRERAAFCLEIVVYY
jgi:hypothetical protein